MSYVKGWLDELGTWIKDNVVAFFEWAMEQAFELLTLFGYELLGMMPPGVAEGVVMLRPYLAVANYWFPVQEGLVLVSIWMMAWALFVFIKMVLKLVPSIG